jgi:hypothetical protein
MSFDNMSDVVDAAVKMRDDFLTDIAPEGVLGNESTSLAGSRYRDPALEVSFDDPVYADPLLNSKPTGWDEPSRDGSAGPPLQRSRRSLLEPDSPTGYKPSENGQAAVAPEGRYERRVLLRKPKSRDTDRTADQPIEEPPSEDFLWGQRAARR